MTVYFCNVIRPDGTNTIKEVDAWDRQAAARQALLNEPSGSHTTARPVGDPTAEVRDDMNILVKL